jgi:enoyl-CoA hydratase
MSEYESVVITRDDGVAEVELIGPGKGNTMGPDFFKEVPRIFESIDEDDEIRAVIIRGRGENFTYGLDLGAMMSEMGPYLMGPQMAGKRTRFLDVIRGYQRSGDAIAHCRKPVICAIQGWCIGGGLDIAAASDIRLCSANARFSLREVKVAIVADLGSLQRLPLIIGEGPTRELAFTGKDIDAERALMLGLVSEITPTHEALLESARATARAICENPPLVVQGIKQVMGFSADRRVAEGLDYVALWNTAFLQSMDLTEAFTAFREKRPPKFRGQ